MKCNVIQDLMLLCADGCCSDESRALVEEHIRVCDACRKAYDEIRSELSVEAAPAEPVKAPALRRVSDWKASVMQSVLLFLSFALLTFGVAREAATPTGETNGLWAVAIVVPTAGFLLSLANWYFVRLYPSRRLFAVCSLLVTLALIVCGYGWAVIHYEWTGVFGRTAAWIFPVVGGILSAAFCSLSGLLSRKYALMLGKE